MKFQKSKAGFVLSGIAERDAGKNTFRYYIGIDPDCEASGFAIWSKLSKKLMVVTNYRFFDLVNLLEQWRHEESVIVHVEGAWLKEKSNWHIDNQRKGVGEMIAKRVGANHQVGKLIVEACIMLDLTFVVREPKTPYFKDAAFFQKVTKWDKQTNEDGRSAANYIFGF